MSLKSRWNSAEKLPCQSAECRLKRQLSTIFLIIMKSPLRLLYGLELIDDCSNCTLCADGFSVASHG